MTSARAYVEACREVLRSTREAARAADRGQWTAVLAHLAARQRAMDAADRAVPGSASDPAVLRAQALPLLQEALEVNRRLVDRARRLRDLLRPVVAAEESRFLDTYR
ncbi:MAG: hypothetical protein RMM30_05235 [Armatimonadota bacterium]|nr:hypothetical protein [Armatimonadota bacterium]MDW8155971.1 hypothetical protein [Armatimonadota bacterium]